MLGKLIKYDLKANIRLFSILHALLLAACIFGRFAFVRKMDLTASTPSAFTNILLTFSGFVLLFSAVSFGTYILVAVRYYKDLFTDQGYLTWTLPATPTQQLWSKIISGGIWFFLDVLILGAALVVLLSTPNVSALYSEMSADVAAKLGMPLLQYMSIIYVFCLLITPLGPLTLYMCIAVGQLFPSHRILGAVVSYFVVNFITQIITLFAMAVTGNLNPFYSGHGDSYLFDILCISIVLSLILIIISYFVTDYIMKRKVNLI